LIDSPVILPKVSFLSALPIVTIVGRPNVGKSALFNRLMGRRLSIVSDVAGTTRDRLVGRAEWDGRSVLLEDTGGLDFQPGEVLTSKVRRQVDNALLEADLVLFVVDAATGLHPTDQEVAQLIRRHGKPVILVANKTEGRLENTLAGEFLSLGFGDAAPVSAIHNTGVEDLKEDVLSRLPASGEPQAEAKTLQLAIVGRPNAGKSSLMNAIVGEERSIVHDQPGTTRDVVDTMFTYRGRQITALDTAGMRRRGHVSPGIERYSVLRVLQAIERCDVALLVLDASELVTAQDTHIAGYVVDAYKGTVIVVNKWDLAPALGLTKEDALSDIRRRFNWAAYVPVCFASAVKREGIDEVLDTACRVFEQRMKQTAQKELDGLLKDVLARHPPSSHPARTARFHRLLQVQAGPPTFVVYVNQPKYVHFTYRRYLENALRAKFGFEGNHLHLVFKPSGRETPETD